jgi:cobalt-zinc-cadmium efflux system outer membrane protein
MKKTIIAILNILFLLSCFNSFGQVLSLDSVLSKIEKSNLSLKMFAAKINALTQYAEGAKNWDAPTVGGGMWMTPYENPYMGMAMISVEQMFPSPARLNAKKDYLGSMSAEQEENKSYAKNQIFAFAKRNYYRCAILKKKLVILKESESIISMMIKSAEISYANSDSKLNTIYKAKARLAALQSMILTTNNEIQQKNVLLNTLMNRNKNLIFDADTMFQIKNYEFSTPDSSSLLTDRSDFRAIDKSSDILKYKQKMELTKRKPSFGVRYNNMTPFNPAKPSQYNIMGMMTIPIAPWASREYKANVKALDFEMEELQWKKKNLINETLGKINTIALAMQNVRQQLSSYDQSILPALQNNLNTSQLAYSQNKENLFVVLDAWEALNSAKMERLNKIEELLYIQVEYEKELEKR